MQHSLEQYASAQTKAAGLSATLDVPVLLRMPFVGREPETPVVESPVESRSREPVIETAARQEESVTSQPVELRLPARAKSGQKMRQLAIAGGLLFIIVAAVATVNRQEEPTQPTASEPATQKWASESAPSWQIPSTATDPPRFEAPTPSSSRDAAHAGDISQVDPSRGAPLFAAPAGRAASEANGPARISSLPPYPQTSVRSASPQPQASTAIPNRAAEFQGIITAPKLRAQHDRDGSSIH
jgi:hypothetical protein